MNLSQLHYFQKLAELEHYTNAAKELFITQPSLSDSIASLEKELGVLLFQKSGRNVKLTKYGAEFYHYVSNALSELERGITLMKEKSGPIGGTIDVGCIPTLLGDFLPGAIGRYKKRNPLAKFNIYHGMSIDIAHTVASGKYDMGFCSKVSDETDLVFVPVMAQELVAIVNNTHALKDQKELYLNQLKSSDLITYRTTLPIGQVISGFLKEKKIPASYLYDDEISLGGIVSSTQAVAIVAKTSLLRQFDNLVYITLLDAPKDARLVYMVYSKKNFITAAVESFINFIVLNEINLPEKQPTRRVD